MPNQCICCVCDFWMFLILFATNSSLFSLLYPGFAKKVNITSEGGLAYVLLQEHIHFLHTLPVEKDVISPCLSHHSFFLHTLISLFTRPLFAPSCFLWLDDHPPRFICAAGLVMELWSNHTLTLSPVRLFAVSLDRLLGRYMYFHLFRPRFFPAHTPLPFPIFAGACNPLTCFNGKARSFTHFARLALWACHWASVVLRPAHRALLTGGGGRLAAAAGRIKSNY